MSEYKWQQLGLHNEQGNMPKPTIEQVKSARGRFEEAGLEDYCWEEPVTRKIPFYLNSLRSNGKGSIFTTSIRTNSGWFGLIR